MDMNRRGRTSRLREVADWFGFKYIESLIAELSDARPDHFEEDAAWYQSFLTRIRD
jgi:hypothetical protein